MSNILLTAGTPISWQDLSIYLSINLTFYMSIYQSIFLNIYLSIYIYIFISLYIYPSIYLSIFRSDPVNTWEPIRIIVLAWRSRDMSKYKKYFFENSVDCVDFNLYLDTLPSNRYRMQSIFASNIILNFKLNISEVNF